MSGSLTNEEDQKIKEHDEDELDDDREERGLDRLWDSIDGKDEKKPKPAKGAEQPAADKQTEAATEKPSTELALASTADSTDFKPEQIADKPDAKLNPGLATADKVFGDFGGMMGGAQGMPETRTPDYGNLTFHDRTAAMVKEFIEFGNKKALADLRDEAGRSNWESVSSAAATAYHRCAVVKAVQDYEKAIGDSDAVKQKAAMQELIKLRTLKLGTEYKQVYEAIDKYLERQMQKSPELFDRDSIDNSRRRALDTMSLDFKTAASSFAAFAIADKPADRLAAYEQFKAATSENPSQKLLNYSARMGDFVGALGLKEALEAAKQDPEKLYDAIELLQKTSPQLTKVLLEETLKDLQANPATKEQFKDKQELKVQDLLDIIYDGKADALIPSLKKAISTEEFANTFKDYDEIRNSKHSPADLLRAGLPNANDREKFDEQVEKANWEIEENNKKYQELERKLLARETNDKERQEILRDMRQLINDADIIGGDSKGLTNTYDLEAINNLMAVMETKNPAKAAQNLERLQKMAESGSPYATQLLEKLFPGNDAAAKTESALQKLKSGSDAAADALKEIQAAGTFVPAEVDKLRIQNLTREFQGNQHTGNKKLDELLARLEVEKKNGNVGAADWIDWTKAAKLVGDISVGGGGKHADKLKAVDELSEMAKSGNQHAQKMLLGIILHNANDADRAQWNYNFNSEPGPKTLFPKLGSVDSYNREYVEAALKGLGTVYSGNKELLSRADAHALALAMGKSQLDYTREKIDEMLKVALQGPKGGEVLQGLFDAIKNNGPGGEHLARTFLHGANLPEFNNFFPSFARWANSGDKVGMVVLAGILAGRRDKNDLDAPSRDILLKTAGDKDKQAAVLETMLDAYKLDVEKTKTATHGFSETLGDALAKNQRFEIPQKLFEKTRDVLRKELERFGEEYPRLNPEELKRYEDAVRGMISASKYMEQSDLKLLKVGPELAKAFKEKEWDIPVDIQWAFKSKMLANLGDKTAVSALEIIGTTSKILEPSEVSQIYNTLGKPLTPEVEKAYVRCLLQIVGANGGRSEVKETAINQLEKSNWYNKDLDPEIRTALSDYVRGRVGDVKLVDKVMSLIGDCGVEPPLPLVLSRLGVPLTNEMIRDVADGLRNFNGDRAAYLKVIERAVILSAIPPDQNLLGHPNLSELVQQMAAGPLTEDTQFGYLSGNQVDKLVEGLEALHYDQLIAKAAAAGVSLSKSQIQDSILGYDFTGANPGKQIIRGPEAAYEQSVSNLKQITKDGHQTSYWWLAAGGVGYLARRFGPGGTEDKFAEKQKEALTQWKAAQVELGKSTAERDALMNGIKRLDTAKTVGQYVSELGKGNFAASDKIALKVLAKTGSDDLGRTAEFMREGLLGKYREPGEIWARLKRMHATNLDAPPIFFEGDRGAAEARKFLKEANFQMPDASQKDKYHDMRELVHDVALKEAFRAVDQDSRMTAAIGSLGKLSALVGQTQMLFHDGMAGYRSEEYVKVARRMGGEIEKTLKEIREQAPQIRQLVKDLEEARDGAKDESTRKGLDARIQQLRDILIGYVPNSNGETNSKRYNELKEMCRVMNSSDFDAGTFGKWLTDNAGTMILVTTAIAGIALMPFSGGASGILTAVAVAALIATTGYVANELWKEGMHQFGNAAYGSDFLRTVVQLTTGLEARQTGLRYDPATQTFQGPPGMDKVMLDALKEIGKETAINLLGAGFGKVLGVGLKALTGPGRLAAGEITKDTAKLVANLDRLAANNPATQSWAKRFASAWVSSFPWAVAGATTEAIAQDTFKDYVKDNEVAQFMLHATCTCLTVMAHKTGGHMLRPRVIGNGSIEVPHDKAQFLAEMRKQYEATGKPMPKVVMEGDVAKVSVGGRVVELRFIDPAKVVAELNKNGVKPNAETTGKVEPVKPSAVPPETAGRLLGGDTPALGSGQTAKLPPLEPGHMSAAEIVRPMHPEGSKGAPSVLSFTEGTPVVFTEPGGTGKPATYSRGYAVAEQGGGATLVRFTETPQEMMFSPKKNFVKAEHHKLLSDSDGVQYFYDSKAKSVLRVSKGAEGLQSQVVESVKINGVAAADMGNVKPAIRTEPSLKVTVDGNTLEVSSAGRRALVVGPGAKADIRLTGTTAGAVVMTDGKGFYARSTGGGKVEVLGKDGSRKTVSTSESVALRSTDTLIIDGKPVSLVAGESQRYTVMPTRNAATENRGAKAVDMVKTPAVKDIPPGFTYFEDLPGKDHVNPRLFDAARDPVLRAFEAEALSKFAHLKGDPPALMKALTDYVHERMTPRTIDQSFGQPSISQGRGMNKVAGNVDAATGGTTMIGDLIARRSAVCLDQAMVLKYLAQKMGVQAEVTTGKWNNQPHAWVTMIDGNGKRIVYDPRNNNLLYNNERGGVAQPREYQPFTKDNPRKVETKTLSGEMVTDYSSIRPKLEELSRSLDTKVTAAERDAFMGSLKTALTKVDPMTLKVIGEKLAQLNNIADAQKRLPQLTALLQEPNNSKLGPMLEKILDPKMPLDNIKSMTEFLKSEAANNVLATGDAQSIAKFRENANQMAHSPELPQRVKIAEELGKQFEAEAKDFRIDFALDPNIPLAKLSEFHTTMQKYAAGDMVFALPEVVKILKASGPEGARHLVENLPDLTKTFKDADHAVDKLSALRMVAESSKDSTSIMQLPLIFEQNAVHLNDPISKTFVEKSMKEGLGKVFDDPANQYMFSPAGESVMASMKGVFDSQKLGDQFNKAICQRFEKLMQEGKPIQVQEKEWFGKNKNTYGIDQALIDKVRAYEPPPPKLMFFPGGENMLTVIKNNEVFKSEYGDTLKLADTTNNGNHLIQCEDAAKRTHYLIVKPGQNGEATIFRVIDLDGTPLSQHKMFAKHLADIEPATLQQMSSGMYNDKQIRRSDLDVSIKMSPPGSNATPEPVKAYGMSWRIGGGLDRTIMVVTQNAKGQPTIVVLNRCSSKSDAAVQASYNNIPKGVVDAVGAAARPSDWTVVP